MNYITVMSEWIWRRVFTGDRCLIFSISHCSGWACLGCGCRGGCWFWTHCPRNSYVSANMVNTRLELPPHCSHTPFSTSTPSSPFTRSLVLLSAVLSLSLAVSSHVPLFLAGGHRLHFANIFPPPDLLLSHLHRSPPSPLVCLLCISGSERLHVLCFCQSSVCRCAVRINAMYWPTCLCIPSGRGRLQDFQENNGREHQRHHYAPYLELICKANNPELSPDTEKQSRETLLFLSKLQNLHSNKLLNACNWNLNH